MNEHTKVAKILQLTDLHLFGDQTVDFLGINTHDTFTEVVNLVRKNNPANDYDVAVISGDISQDYSSQAYQTAIAKLSGIARKMAFIPGNHDDPNYVRNKMVIATTGGRYRNPSVINIANWKIILLNSHLHDNVAGFLARSELEFLRAELASSLTNLAVVDPAKNHGDATHALHQFEPQHVIIFIHHQVLPVGSAWLDQLGVKNPADFFAVIDQFTNIKAVFCGHVHQATEQVRNNVEFASTPAVSWQFTKNSAGFKLDKLMPGYRDITLFSDGTYTTRVTRLGDVADFIPDQKSSGY